MSLIHIYVLFLFFSNCSLCTVLQHWSVVIPRHSNRSVAAAPGDTLLRWQHYRRSTAVCHKDTSELQRYQSLNASRHNIVYMLYKLCFILPTFNGYTLAVMNLSSVFPMSHSRVWDKAPAAKRFLRLYRTNLHSKTALVLKTSGQTTLRDPLEKSGSEFTP